jgi:hypothetical protein
MRKFDPVTDPAAPKHVILIIPSSFLFFVTVHGFKGSEIQRMSIHPLIYEAIFAQALRISGAFGPQLKIRSKADRFDMNGPHNWG